MPGSSVLHVAVGVVYDEFGRVLLSQRPAGVHQGGRWEFPGGKLEPGEEAPSALKRELHEELGITPVHYRPLIRIQHDYSDLKVLLDVWRVDQFTGPRYQNSGCGCEGQPVQWVRTEALDPAIFPVANRPIITAVQLPDSYLFTPEPDTDVASFLDNLSAVLKHGIKLVRLRAWSLGSDSYACLVHQVVELCHEFQAMVMLSGDLDEVICLLQAGFGHGLHLSSHQLRRLHQRSLVPAGTWLAASCHNAEELEQAQALGMDFVVLSPLFETPSHPAAVSLGWPRFQQLVEQSTLPVYALGGLSSADVEQVWQSGGQGIAAIRSLWGG